MPFAGYPSFAACVSDNADMANPEAFCAWLEHRASGNWPAEMTAGLPEDMVAKYWQAFGEGRKAEDILRAEAAVAPWQRRNGSWLQISAHAAMQTRDVVGVEIFAAGTHNGDKYSDADLDAMVTAFRELRGHVDPPVKLGHTSPEFNAKVARELGISTSVITGDSGKGAMAFGWITNLRRQGHTLVADFQHVPEPIVRLIESKALNKVSCEIAWDFKVEGKNFRRVLVGVALLGAELPAVTSIAGLEKSAIFTAAAKATAVVEYSNTEGQMKDILKTLGLADTATEQEAIGAITDRKKAFEDVAGMMAQMAKILGLPEGATPQDIMTAMQKVMEKMGGMNEAQKEFANLQQKVATLTTQVAEHQMEKRVASYTAQFNALKALSGDAEALAKEMVDLEDKSPALAKSMMARYAAQNEALEKAGVLANLGTPKQGDKPAEDPFEARMKTYAAEHKVTEQQAMAALSQSDPKEFAAYRGRVGF